MSDEAESLPREVVMAALLDLLEAAVVAGAPMAARDVTLAMARTIDDRRLLQQVAAGLAAVATYWLTEQPLRTPAQVQARAAFVATWIERERIDETLEGIRRASW